MTTELAERRKGRVLRLFFVAAALAAIAAVTLAIESRSLRPDAAAGPVLPGLAESIRSAQRITVTSAQASYHIERTARGWAMRDRDDFPVEAARLAQFTDGLEQLHYQRRMTSDPSKHERLGVTDPRQGGRGILVQVEDGRRALIVDLILGVEPNGGLYVRRTGENQVWAAQGELPPLRDAAAWLDLRPLELTPERLARVEITPAEGRAYVLARDAADGPWRIASPALAAGSQAALGAAAVRITGLSPTDVRTAPAIQGAAQARVRALTFDGVSVDAELVDQDGRSWLKLVARAAGPEQEAAALAINNRAASWAYALRSADAAALAPPLSSLMPGAVSQ
jgi:Domain of unknown function (DUF4340)